MIKRGPRIDGIAVAAALVLGGLSWAAGPSPAAASAAVTTPVFPQRAPTWPAGTGPREGNPHGTIMDNAEVRTTAQDLIANIAPLNAAPFGTWGVEGGRVMTDVGLAGLALGGTGGTLWLLDVATGTNRSRDEPSLTATARVVGTTADAWVTIGAAGEVAVDRLLTLWPFDGGPSSTLLLAGQSSSLLVGPDGVLYVAVGPDTCTLELLDPVTHAVTDLVSWPRAAGATASMLRMSGGAVGWFAGGSIGMWEKSTGARTVPVDPSSDEVVGLAVVPGGIGVVLSSINVDWYVDARFFVNDATSLRAQASLSSYRLSIWSSATATGAPAIQIRRTESGDPSVPTAGVFDTWWAWTPTDTAVKEVAVSAYPSYALVRSVVGGNGTVGITYWTAPSRVGMAAYAVDATSARTVFGSDYAADSSWLPAVAGRRSAVIERWLQRGAYSNWLVLRNGGRATAAVLAPVGPVTVSGPFAAAGPPGGTARVMGPDASLVDTAAQVARLAQDGPRLAYAQRNGALLLLDTTVPRSASNPRIFTGLCPRGVLDCVQWIGLSGRWLVASSDNGRLVIVDLLRGTRRSVALGACRPTSISGPVVLCTFVDRRARTVDVGARTLLLRALPGAAAAAALAGRYYAAYPDPASLAPTTLSIARIPAANGVIGPPRALGPWSAYGPYVSTAYRWSPQISTTDPLTSWALVLRSSSGRVVGRWSGRAPDREIVGITWAARDLSGHPVPAGTYRWTLTGSSAYGALTSTLGTGTATGVVRVVRQVRSVSTVRVTSTATPRYRLATVVATLRTASSRAVVPGAVVSLWLRGSTGRWSQVDSGRTTSTGVVIWRVVVRATGVYQVRHAADPRTTASATAAFTLRR